MSRPIIHSYGGGTQSIAITVLVSNGRLPKPERVVIADTGREATETWEYTDKYVRPLLARVGLEIEIADHSLSTVDMYSIGGNGNKDLLIPAYTGVGGGQLRTFCSSEWKKNVIRRWLRNEGYGPKNPVEQWVGISLDEIGRCKPSGVNWLNTNWPLLYLHSPALNRLDCIDIVKSAGLPLPPKSSCYMCPFRSDTQWKRLKEQYPEDWAKAVVIDKEIRENDIYNSLYLHRSRVPLENAVLLEKQERVLPLFGDTAECDSGYCFV